MQTPGGNTTLNKLLGSMLTISKTSLRLGNDRCKSCIENKDTLVSNDPSSQEGSLNLKQAKEVLHQRSSSGYAYNKILHVHLRKAVRKIGQMTSTAAGLKNSCHSSI